MFIFVTIVDWIYVNVLSLTKGVEYIFLGNKYFFKPALMFVLHKNLCTNKVGSISCIWIWSKTMINNYIFIVDLDPAECV